MDWDFMVLLMLIVKFASKKVKIWLDFYFNLLLIYLLLGQDTLWG
jgi:hypothetical protein